MPEQISIYELIVNATVLVQVVMALLALASLVSWMMIFQRWLLLRRTLNELDAFEDHFWSGVDLRELYSQLMQEDSLNSIENLFVVGFREYTRLADQAGADAEAIMQRHEGEHKGLEIKWRGPVVRTGRYRRDRDSARRDSDYDRRDRDDDRRDRDRDRDDRDRRDRRRDDDDDESD